MKRILTLLLALLPLPASAQTLTTGNFAHFVTSAATATGPFSTSDFFIMSRGNAPFRVPASTFFPGGPFMLPNASNSLTSTFFPFGSSLYPAYQTGTTTTANAVAGSNSIVVASAANISVGDVVSSTSPSFLAAAPPAVWVTGIAGTTISLSSNANANQTGATVVFGTDRFTGGSTLFTNTLGAKYGYFGAASKNRSTWPAQYWIGADQPSDHALYSVSPDGTVAGLFAARTSDNPGGATIPLGCLAVGDNPGVAVPSWCAYFEADLLASASRLSHINEESSIRSEWATTSNDPYTINPFGFVTNLRLDAGIGSGTANNITDALEITNNGAGYRAGITIQSNALDTAAGRIAPALQMATSHAIQWYRAAGQLAWNIFSTSTTTSNQSLALSDTGATFNTANLGLTAATGDANLLINSNTGAQQSLVYYQSAAVTKFLAGLNAAGQFIGFDVAHGGKSFLVVATDGGVALGEVGQAGVTVGSPTGGQKGDSTLNVAKSVYNNGSLVWSQTAPTIASGGCTTGSAQSISASNGTVAFEITLGGATCGSTITLTMPTAANGWVCDAHNITNPASNVLDQSSTGTTSVVLQNYVRTTGVGGNFTGADHLIVKCSAY